MDSRVDLVFLLGFGIRMDESPLVFRVILIFFILSQAIKPFQLLFVGVSIAHYGENCALSHTEYGSRDTNIL